MLWKHPKSNGNAQLARGIISGVVPLRELPADQYEALVREYCMEQFVSRGMIADYAIHDKGDGNPHAHAINADLARIGRAWQVAT